MFDSDSANVRNLELHANRTVSLNAELGLQSMQDKAQSFSDRVTGHPYTLVCYTWVLIFTWIILTL